MSLALADTRDQAPTEEADIVAAVSDAAGASEPLWVIGAGTKASMLRPVQAARSLSTRNHRGITLYRPKELILSARAGTPINEIEATLAEQGQHLIAEPPAFDFHGGDTGAQTLGGAVAANIAGPRRVAWGAMRDHVLGVRAVNGSGELIRSGGRVLKNVTGLDLCKLLSGSNGTLAVMTEITVKVLPAPEAAATLVLPSADPVRAVAALSAALGSPYGITAAAWLPFEASSRVPGLAALGKAAALIRIEEFAASVTYRIAKLRDELSAEYGDSEVLDAGASRAVWRAVGAAAPLAVAANEAVWRISVRPSAGPHVLAAIGRSGGLRGFLDWGGGLVWIAGPAKADAHRAVEAAAQSARGTWSLMHADAGLRGAVHVVPPEPPQLAAITGRVKAAFDPKFILNPGRVYAGL